MAVTGNDKAKPDGIEALKGRISELEQGQDRLRRRSEELDALHKLVHCVGRTLVLEEVVESALETVKGLLAPDMVMLFLRQGDDLVPQGRRPRQCDGCEELEVHKVGECLCGLAVDNERAMYSVDIHSDPRCTWAECREAGFKSFAALPLPGRDGVIGVLGLASRSERDFEERSAFLESLAAEVAIGVQNAVYYGQVQQQREELERQAAERRRLEDEIVGVSEKVQGEIGRELHDGLMQQLTGVAYLSDALEGKLGESSEMLASDVREISSLLRGLIEQVDGLAKGLYPAELEGQGLVGAVKGWGATISRLYGVNVTYEGESEYIGAGPLASLHVYRIIQEAVSNAIRHGDAKNIRIGFSCSESQCVLSVDDDGAGFSPEAVERGMGLGSIEYRGRAIGGQIEISSGDDGTRLVCRFARGPAGDD